ncbi:hemin receptor [Bacteroidia bacterium]|nr:hemin receptor [Bacteroidia bacterium]
MLYSQYSSIGTARYASLGGAMGALGANLGAIGSNPATLGVYKRGEISITPALVINSEKIKHLSNDWLETNRTAFKVPNFGAVLAWQRAASNSRNEWKYFQFGVTYSQTADFNSLSRGTGYTGAYSQDANGYHGIPTYLDVLTNQANAYGNVAQGSIRGDAYDAGLIAFDSTANRFFNDLSDTNGLTQRFSTKTSGGIYEGNFAFAANYGDIVYIGVALGLNSLDYTKELTLEELDRQNLHPDFDSWKFSNKIVVRGTGINFKAGVIVRPVDWMRVGVAIHTPTAYTMRESYKTSMYGIGRYISNNSNGGTDAQYRYAFTSPFRLIGSLGFVLGKHLSIGAEYEYLNYAQMKFRNSSDDWESEDAYKQDNAFIKENYKHAGVAKIGIEGRFSPLSLRVGYNYFVAPTDIYHETKHAISGGIGISFNRFYIDAAYMATLNNYQMQLYPEAPNTQYHNFKHQVLLTLGYRF